MSRLRRIFTALALTRGALHAHEPPPDHEAEKDPRETETGASRASEIGLAVLLAVSGLFFFAFAVLLALSADTQLLGGMAGGGLAFLSASFILAGLRVAPRETDVEEREIGGQPEVLEEDEELLQGAAAGVSRRKLLLGAAGLAGTGATAAAAMPVTALGPSATVLNEAPWRDGRLLVEENGKPIKADDISVGSFITAFAEGVPRAQLGSPLMLVHLDPSTLELPEGREDWAPEGFLAFSKICTHSGCAVSIFRYPTYEPTAEEPALVCPCHYSTFDVRRGAEVILGPAGRALPQLPLRIRADRTVVAAGPLSGSVGPAWWGTDR